MNTAFHINLIQSIYDKHFKLLGVLKENRAKSENQGCSQSELDLIDQQIQTLAAVLSELNKFLKKQSRNSQKRAILSLQECKEYWASAYNKTWSQVRQDFEYGTGLMKLYSMEQILDMVAELYAEQFK